jgi:transglutaminase-like putative cysteine protease
MYYTIRHVTKFAYDVPISESVMEVRMQPRTEGAQRCIRFSLSTSPAARVKMYADSEGNVVHHFNIPGKHGRLTLSAEALVECAAFPERPESLASDAWGYLDALTASGEFWDALNPSPFVRRTSLLDEFARELGLERGDDPLSTLRRLVKEMHERLEYSPRTTRVDSPIDDALQARRGVCQDFAHILIALVRRLGVPCRYVSGYLFHQDSVSPLRSTDSATHAWVEAHLPDVGWVGLDPTNNILAGERHIRVAIGRDYADVPPTRGVFKGESKVRSELSVGVAVGTTQPAVGLDVPAFTPWMSHEATAPRADAEASQQQ